MLVSLVSGAYVRPVVCRALVFTMSRIRVRERRTNAYLRRRMALKAQVGVRVLGSCSILTMHFDSICGS